MTLYVIIYLYTYNCSLIFNRYVDVYVSLFTQIQLILQRCVYTRLQSIRCLCMSSLYLFKLAIFMYVYVCINNLRWYSKYVCKCPIEKYCYPFWAFLTRVKVERKSWIDRFECFRLITRMMKKIMRLHLSWIQYGDTCVYVIAIDKFMHMRGKKNYLLDMRQG